MTEKKDPAGKPPLSGGKTSGIVGLGDLLKLAVAKHGGLPPKPTRSPRPGGNRKVVPFRGGRS